MTEHFFVIVFLVGGGGVGSDRGGGSGDTNRIEMLLNLGKMYLNASLTDSLAPLGPLYLRAPLRSFAHFYFHYRAHGREVSVFEMNASVSYDFYPL